MIRGAVNVRLEATIPVQVRDAQGQVVHVDGIVDTGFNGYLVLPHCHIQALGLLLAGNRQATLADGSVVVLDIYLGAVV
jgi:predicted aspartyl protease